MASTCTLNHLPPELREKILKPLLTEPWKSQTYTIIKALRPDRDLYSEALAMFTKRQTFELRERNNWGLKDFTENAVLTIEKLKINLKGRSLPRSIPKALHSFRPSNIKSVSIEYGGETGLLKDDFEQIIRFLGGSPLVEKVSVTYPLYYDYAWLYDVCNPIPGQLITYMKLLWAGGDVPHLDDDQGSVVSDETSMEETWFYWRAGNRKSPTTGKTLP